MFLKDIKPNPNNPRLIKDEKFEKLKKSIQDFPKMMALRPMVLDENNIVLGGNMRLKALKELGYKEVPDEWVKKATDLSQDEIRRFIIVDNVGFGEHDWDILANEWNAEELKEWGLDVPNYSLGLDVNEMTESEIDITEHFDPIGKSSGMQRVVFLFDGPDEAESYLKKLQVNYEKRNMAWQVNLSSLSIL